MFARHTSKLLNAPIKLFNGITGGDSKNTEQIERELCYQAFLKFDKTGSGYITKKVRCFVGQNFTSKIQNIFLLHIVSYFY